MVFLVGQVPLLPNTSVSQFGWLVSLGEMATLALVQLYRYQRVSSPRERQQTKWVVFGLAVPITVAVSVSVPYLIFPAFTEPGSLYPLAYNQVSIMRILFSESRWNRLLFSELVWNISGFSNSFLAASCSFHFGVPVEFSILLCASHQKK